MIDNTESNAGKEMTDTEPTIEAENNDGDDDLSPDLLSFLDELDEDITSPLHCKNKSDVCLRDTTRTTNNEGGGPSLTDVKPHKAMDVAGVEWQRSIQAYAPLQRYDDSSTKVDRSSTSSVPMGLPSIIASAQLSGRAAMEVAHIAATASSQQGINGTNTTKSGKSANVTSTPSHMHSCYKTIQSCSTTSSASLRCSPAVRTPLPIASTITINARVCPLGNASSFSSSSSSMSIAGDVNATGAANPVDASPLIKPSSSFAHNMRKVGKESAPAVIDSPVANESGSETGIKYTPQQIEAKKMRAMIERKRRQALKRLQERSGTQLPTQS